MTNWYQSYRFSACDSHIAAANLGQNELYNPYTGAMEAVEKDAVTQSSTYRPGNFPSSFHPPTPHLCQFSIPPPQTCQSYLAEPPPSPEPPPIAFANTTITYISPYTSIDPPYCNTTPQYITIPLHHAICQSLPVMPAPFITKNDDTQVNIPYFPLASHISQYNTYNPHPPFTNCIPVHEESNFQHQPPNSQLFLPNYNPIELDIAPQLGTPSLSFFDSSFPSIVTADGETNSTSVTDVDGIIVARKHALDIGVLAEIVMGHEDGLDTNWEENEEDAAEYQVFVGKPETKSTTTKKEKDQNIADFRQSQSQNPSLALIQFENQYQESEPNFSSRTPLASPDSVIGQATMDGTVGELRFAIKNLCVSEILKESEMVVPQIEWSWREANIEVDIQSIISGFVEIPFSSVIARVLWATVFLPSELGSRDDSVTQTLTTTDFDVEHVVALFRKGLLETILLIYLLRPAVIDMDMVNSLLTVLRQKEDDFLKKRMKPKSALVLLLGQILGSAQENTISRVMSRWISEKVITDIVSSLEAEWQDERIAAVGILLRCMQEDSNWWNIITDKAKLVPVLESFLGANDALQDQGPVVVASFILQLDILVEPRKTGIYREEVIDILISCLRNSDFPAAQILAFEMLKVFSEGNDSCNDMWNHTELVQEDSSVNGEVLTIVCLKHKIFSSRLDGTTKVWDGKGSILHFIQETQEHTKKVTSLAISQIGNKLYSGSLDKTVRVWSVSNEGMQCEQGHDMEDHVNSLADANRISCFIPQGAGTKVNSWNEASKLLNPKKYVKCLTLVHGKLYCGCQGNSIQEIDLATGTLRTIQSGSRHFITKTNPIYALQVYDGLLYSASYPLDGILLGGRGFGVAMEALFGPFFSVSVCVEYGLIVFHEIPEKDENSWKFRLKKNSLYWGERGKIESIACCLSYFLKSCMLNYVGLTVFVSYNFLHQSNLIEFSHQGTHHSEIRVIRDCWIKSKAKSSCHVQLEVYAFWEFTSDLSETILPISVGEFLKFHFEVMDVEFTEMAMYIAGVQEKDNLFSALVTYCGNVHPSGRKVAVSYTHERGIEKSMTAHQLVTIVIKRAIVGDVCSRNPPLFVQCIIKIPSNFSSSEDNLIQVISENYPRKTEIFASVIKGKVKSDPHPMIIKFWVTLRHIVGYIRVQTVGSLPLIEAMIAEEGYTGHELGATNDADKNTCENKVIQTMLAQTSEEGAIILEPFAIIDRRLIKRGNKPATVVLVQGQTSEATLKQWIKLSRAFPNFYPWGQGNLQGKGNCQGRGQGINPLYEIS